MELVQQQVIWTGNVSRHASVGLAWRYGVVMEGTVELRFLQRTGREEPNSERARGIFEHVDTGMKLELVVTKDIVVTALGKDTRFQDNDAQKIKVMLETQDIWAPGSISLEDIVYMRMKYIDAGAPFDVNEVRQRMKKLAQSRTMPARELTAEEALERLGLDTEFFDEVKELRRIAWENSSLKEANEIDFTMDLDSGKNAELQQESERISALGLRDFTRLDHEEPNWARRKQEEWEEWKASDEYQKIMKESWLADIEEIKSQIEEDKLASRLRSATFGVPKNSTRELSDSLGRRVAEYSEAKVHSVPSAADNDGWFYLGFTLADDYFWIGTRFENIVNSYSVGSEGVKVVFYGDLPFLHPQN